MKIRYLIAFVCCFMPMLAHSSGSIQLTDEDKRRIDEMSKDLHRKEPLPLNEIPNPAFKLARQRVPSFVPKSADKELKKGDTYLHLHGIDGFGMKTKLILRYADDNRWIAKRVERELVFNDLSAPVINAFKQAESFNPSRIVEVDEGDNGYLYQFYDDNDASAEALIRIRLEVLPE